MKKNDVLLIFLKPFIKGKVKTRLAKDIGDRRALEVYETLVRHTVAEAEKLPSNIELIFCYSEEPGPSDRYPGAFSSIIQHGETLGDRMSHAMVWADTQGFREKVIIGSDCATLSVGHLMEAFQQLDKNDVVLGPAEDGGYYLIGMTVPQPGLFENIHWSTDTVYESTLKKIYESNLRVGKLETLSDIDDLDDLRAGSSFLKKDKTLL